MSEKKPFPGEDAPLQEGEIEFSQTAPVSRKAVFEGDTVRQGAYLEVRHPGRETIRVQLDEGEILIGRSSKCRIRLWLQDASRVHSRIIYEDEEYHVEDMDSTNGTFINGVRVQKCILRNNDKIQIGDARIVFVEGRAEKDP